MRTENQIQLDIQLAIWVQQNRLPDTTGTPRTRAQNADPYTRWKAALNRGNFSDIDIVIEALSDKRDFLTSLVNACDALLVGPTGIYLESNIFYISNDNITARVEWFQDLIVSLQDLNSMIGLTTVKDQVADMVSFLYINGESQVKQNTFHNITLYGAPGTGKTVVAKRLAPILYRLGVAPVNMGNYTRATTADFTARFSGQTVTKTRRLMLSSLGGVLHFDEAYTLIKEGPAAEDYGTEALGQIVNDLDQYKGLGVMIMSGYKDKMDNTIYNANPGILRRFPYQWTIEPYSADELFEILMQRFDESGLVGPPTETLDTLKQKREYYVDTLYNLIVANDNNLFEITNAAAMGYIIQIASKIKASAVFLSGDSSTKNIIDDNTLSMAVIYYSKQLKPAETHIKPVNVKRSAKRIKEKEAK